jgi:beta-fructofuranosidase
MSLPRVLTINADGELEMNPAVEVETLRGAEQSFTLQPGNPVKQTLTTLRSELHIPLNDAQSKIALRLLTQGSVVWELLVDVSMQLVTCCATKFALPQPLKPDDALRIFIDASVIECFIAAREALTSRVYTLAPDKTELHIELLAGATRTVKQWPLAAISPDRLTS